MTDVNHPPHDPENPAVTEGEELSASNEEQKLTFAQLAQTGHAPTELDPDAEPVLSVDNLKMYFPVKSSGLVRRTIGHVQAVDGISFQVPRGGSLGLVGESGCGKSTTGRLITRLYTPTGGSMQFGEKKQDIARMSNRELKPLRRDVQMIFQDPYTSLNPRHTVGAIVGAPLEVHNVVPKNKVLPRVQELLEVVGLNPEHYNRYPNEFSGGQRQRVAMGRAIVRKPQVFLMDEPLSNLDAKMRVQTRTDIAKLQQDLGITTVYVTHDQVEAMTMGDRVAVMKLGVLQQVDTPLKLYDKPANLFVAGFIGSPQMNLIEAVAKDGKAFIGEYEVPVDPAAAAKMKGNITIGVRPENWRMVDSGQGLPVKTTVVEELGADAYLYGTSDVEGTPSALIVRTSGRDHVRKGEVFHVSTDPQHVHVFDTDTGERLSD